MKMIFLFDKEIRRRFNLGTTIPSHALPDFAPFDFGPFSSQVFDDLEFLVNAGFVRVKKVGDGVPLPEEGLEFAYWRAGAGAEEEEVPYQQEEYALTLLGKEFVETGQAGRLTGEQWGALDEFKKRMTSAPLSAILKYVYTKYPKMTTHSRIRDQIIEESRQ